MELYFHTKTSVHFHYHLIPTLHTCWKHQYLQSMSFTLKIDMHAKQF